MSRQGWYAPCQLWAHRAQTVAQGVGSFGKAGWLASVPVAQQARCFLPTRFRAHHRRPLPMIQTIRLHQSVQMPPPVPVPHRTQSAPIRVVLHQHHLRKASLTAYNHHLLPHTTHRHLPPTHNLLPTTRRHLRPNHNLLPTTRRPLPPTHNHPPTQLRIFPKHRTPAIVTSKLWRR